MGSESSDVYGAGRWHSLAGAVAAIAVLCTLHTYSAILLGTDAFHSAMSGSLSWVRDPDLVFLLNVVIFGIPLAHYGFKGFARWWARSSALPVNGTFREWMLLLQGWTGVFLVFYVGHHLVRVWAVMHFEWDGALNGASALHEGATVSLVQHVAAMVASSPAAIVFQVLGIFSVAFHVANGLWNFGVNWGITSGPRAMARSTVVCAVAFGVIFVQGMDTLATFISLYSGGAA